jgi:hypothetical protein
MDLGVGDFHGKSPGWGGGAQICFHIEKNHAQPDSIFIIRAARSTTRRRLSPVSRPKKENFAQVGRVGVD